MSKIIQHPEAHRILYHKTPSSNLNDLVCSDSGMHQTRICLRQQRINLIRLLLQSFLVRTRPVHGLDTLLLKQDFTVPSITTTAPIMTSFDPAQKRKSTFTLPRRHKTPDPLDSVSLKPSQKSLSERNLHSGLESSILTPDIQSARVSRITFNAPERRRGSIAPPPYGDDSNSSLALPVSRLSESSKSDSSLGDHGRVYATTTTTHTVSTTTTFFRLPGRKKSKGPLFPLPIPTSQLSKSSFAPQGSTSDHPSDSSARQSPPRTPPPTAIYLPSPRDIDDREQELLAPNSSAISANSENFTPRRASSASARSGRISPIATPPTQLRERGRSFTKGFGEQPLENEPLPTPPLPQSGRTSTSTVGRASLGGFFGLSRFRNNSEPLYSRHGAGYIGTPGSPSPYGTKSQSFSSTREQAVVVPARQEGDTPAKYLLRLEEGLRRGAVASILSKSVDDFSKNVLRSYMRGFSFFGYPLDMSIRKLLMEAELPKETQQIDRVLQAFANRYDECNPGIFASPGKSCNSSPVAYLLNP